MMMSSKQKQAGWEMTFPTLLLIFHRGVRHYPASGNLIPNEVQPGNHLTSLLFSELALSDFFMSMLLRNHLPGKYSQILTAWRQHCSNISNPNRPLPTVMILLISIGPYYWSHLHPPMRRFITCVLRDSGSKRRRVIYSTWSMGDSQWCVRKTGRNQACWY